LFDIDPYVFPIPFDNQSYDEFSTRKDLKIGYFTYDGIMECTAPVLRAVNMTKEALEGMGHTLVEFKIPNPE
jgi:fatty acid amide hydrolase